MVHIPLLGIEVPEPRVAEILPNAVEGSLRLCSKAMDAAMRATHPLPEVVQESIVEDVLESYPREIRKVLLRAGQGKHKDEDQLSSELDEAAYGFYRRMIRTSAVGDTEEDQEDVTAYKLGLDRPSASKAARELYEMEQSRRDEAARAGPYSELALTEPERLAMQVAMAASSSEPRAPSALVSGSMASLRGKVRRRGAQGASSVLNAGIGLALAVGIMRGMGMLARQVARLRKPKQKKGKKAKKLMAKTSTELPSPAGNAPGSTGARTTKATAAASSRSRPTSRKY